MLKYQMKHSKLKIYKNLTLKQILSAINYPTGLDGFKNEQAEIGNEKKQSNRPTALVFS